MIKEMFNEMPIVSSITAILILGLLFILIDRIAIKPEAFSGEVIDRHYKAERINSGTGLAVGGNGGIGVVTTTEVDSEEFLIMVKTESKIVTVKCKPELYYQKQVGERIDCNAYKGLFTGTVWYMDAVR